jgi:hypothetical protein
VKDEIRLAWVAHYPNWRSDSPSSLIWVTMRGSFASARASAVIGSEENQISYLCFTIGIPKFEFEEVRNESDFAGEL